MEHAVGTHVNSELVQSFLASLKRCAAQQRFQDGIPVGSVCSGWGVAEMVIGSLNEKLQDLNPSLPKAGLFCPFCAFCQYKHGSCDELVEEAFRLAAFHLIAAPCAVCSGLPLRV